MTDQESFFSSPVRPLLVLAWNALVFVAVVLGPSYLTEGVYLRNRAPFVMAQALLLGCVYLALALAMAVAARYRRVTVLEGGAIAAVCVGGMALMLRYDPTVRLGDTQEFLIAALGLPLAFVPYVSRRWAITVIVFAVVAAGWLPLRAIRVGPTLTIETALRPLTITTFRHVLIGEAATGGAIASTGEAVLLVAGDGSFHSLTPSRAGDAIGSTTLTPPAPLVRTGLPKAPGHTRLTRLLVTGLWLEPKAVSPRVWVAHQYWNNTDKCFTLRVSVRELDLTGGEGRAHDWRTLFESRPCVRATEPFDDFEIGGRLAWFEGKLLLTVGDHGFEGTQGPDFPQTLDNDYGKVLQIDPESGERTIFTIGHRNPQGLTVDREGRVWSTEHGPRGGDEINKLEAGRNYGWPLATYGTDYSTRSWPLAATAPNSAGFTEPVYAFVPSIGISNLVQVRSPLFPEWRDDLLVGSLSARSLFRVRLHGDSPAYVEPIPIGKRIRDVLEAPNGRILLWTDEGDLVELK